MNENLMTVAGDIERVLADLYPYRVPLTILGALIGVAVVGMLVRMGLLRLLSQHRLPVALAAVPTAIVLVLVGNYLLSPLWERSFLEEESPLARVTAGSPADAAPARTEAGGVAPASMASGPRITHQGDFRGADDFHFGKGKAVLIADGGGEIVLRFKDFSVRNGPDLYVYLSADEKPSKVDENLNLGRLKATDGNFNYELPANLDLANAKSVIVWCRQFGVLFASAPLQRL